MKVNNKTKTTKWKMAFASGLLVFAVFLSCIDLTDDVNSTGSLTGVLEVYSLTFGDAGDGTFVAVGRQAGARFGRIAWSVNSGTSWYYRNVFIGPASWSTVNFGGGVFIAGATNGMVGNSRDGTSWHVPGGRSSGPQQWLDRVDSIAFGTYNGADIIIAAGPGRWVCLVDCDSETRDDCLECGPVGEMVRSLDGGRNWERIYHPFTFDLEETEKEEPTEVINTIAFGNRIFLAGTTGGKLLHSSDGGVTWVIDDDPLTYSLKKICNIMFGDGLFLVFSGEEVLSFDGDDDWSDIGKIPFQGPMTFGGDLFVILGEDGKVASSPDGTIWDDTTNLGEDFSGFSLLAYGNGRFMAADSNGRTAYFSLSD